MCEYIEKYDVYTFQLDLPMSIHGYCFEKMGMRCIVINMNLDYYTKMAALQHELKHISRGDLWDERSALEIEKAM